MTAGFRHDELRSLTDHHVPVSQATPSGAMTDTLLPAPASPRRSTRTSAALLLACLLAGLTAGVGAAMTRPVSYTAEARLVVGDQSLSAQAVPGYANAIELLAASYARLVGGDAVQRSVREAVPGAAVTGSPVPGAPVIRIEAVADNQGDAVRAADDAVTALRGAVADPEQRSGQLDALAKTYETAKAEEAEAAERVRRLREASAADDGEVAAGDRAAREQELAVAVRAREIAQLRVAALASAYGEQVQRDATNVVQTETLLSGHVVGNDRRATVQLGGFVGLCAGGALAFALWRRPLGAARHGR
ncbi:hypothetical protein [Motilibacter deserti]|uniref:Subunit length determinant protein n=1 Tax=Motilibacter deserti TaxID=2714956 RepID=A0ABX0GUV2_9ACTN|nr:hypothetical protein [Motilibacter deserti]NHC13442.1 hypothetical protein [Motilibacter deserti]